MISLGVFLGAQDPPKKETRKEKKERKQSEHIVYVDTITVSQRDTLLLKQQQNLKELKELKEKAKKL